MNIWPPFYVDPYQDDMTPDTPQNNIRNAVKMEKLDTSKVFVTHWDALTERRAFMEGQLQKSGINDAEWVTSFPVSKLDNEELIAKYPVVFARGKMDARLSPPVTSLLLKHCYVIEEMVKHQYESALILEDDAILASNFASKFNLYKSQLPEEWDLLWVGTCCDIHAPYQRGSNIYEGDRSRCTHCFLISLKCAQKIHDDMYSIDMPIDWYYNALIKKHSLRNYWAEPPLSMQSKSFKTTLQL